MESQEQVAVREPVDPSLIVEELGPQTFVREIRGVQIHVTDALHAPNLMQEIGRVREVEFRRDGAGTGKSVDIDEYDTGTPPFLQLVAWDPVQREIVGMYRFLPGRLAVNDGGVALPTSRLFEFSQAFLSDYLPVTVELGRSVVNRDAKRAVMGLFAVWSGLGAIVAEDPSIRYFFGKYTVYPRVDARARALLDSFMRLHCPDPDRLVVPKRDLAAGTVESVHSPFGAGYEEDYERLHAEFKAAGEMVPPLVISYLGLSRTMRCFGTAVNPHFGNVLETAILVDIRDIGSKQRGRFVSSYERASDAWLSWAVDPQG